LCDASRLDFALKRKGKPHIEGPSGKLSCNNQTATDFTGLRAGSRNIPTEQQYTKKKSMVSVVAGPTGIYMVMHGKSWKAITIGWAKLCGTRGRRALGKASSNLMSRSRPSIHLRAGLAGTGHHLCSYGRYGLMMLHWRNHCFRPDCRASRRGNSVRKRKVGSSIVSAFRHAAFLGAGRVSKDRNNTASLEPK
jgi:hypothetical protein